MSIQDAITNRLLSTEQSVEYGTSDSEVVFKMGEFLNQIANNFPKHFEDVKLTLDMEKLPANLVALLTIQYITRKIEQMYTPSNETKLHAFYYLQKDELLGI